MKIICSEDIIDISLVEEVSIRKITRSECEIIEYEEYLNSLVSTDDQVALELKLCLKRGMELTGKESSFYVKVCDDLLKIMNEYSCEIGSLLPAPKTQESDIPRYSHDEDPEHWFFQKDGNHKFSRAGYSVNKSESPLDPLISWEFEIRYGSENGNKAKACRYIELSKVLTALNELLNVPESAIKKAHLGFALDVVVLLSGFSQGIGLGVSLNVNHSYKQIQSDIKPIYTKYIDEIKKAESRYKQKEEFIKQHKDTYVLCLQLKDGSEKKYIEGFCGFDIFEKEQEINQLIQHQQKTENSYDKGEENVEYAITWFVNSNIDKYIVSIKGDCESRHRINCILLNKPDFIDDPQEYDHILVCSAGVVLIETKHWKGTVEIRGDGQWIRENENESIGTESPEFQMRRHELMMQNIVPDVKIHSLLCFSNGKIIINGRENFKDYPIVTIDTLEEKLLEICSVDLYSKDDITSIVNEINKHKVNIQE